MLIFTPNGLKLTDSKSEILLVFSMNNAFSFIMNMIHEFYASNQLLLFMFFLLLFMQFLSTRMTQFLVLKKRITLTVTQVNQSLLLPMERALSILTDLDLSTLSVELMIIATMAKNCLLKLWRRIHFPHRLPLRPPLGFRLKAPRHR